MLNLLYIFLLEIVASSKHGEFEYKQVAQSKQVKQEMAWTQTSVW